LQRLAPRQGRGTFDRGAQRPPDQGDRPGPGAGEQIHGASPVIHPGDTHNRIRAALAVTCHRVQEQTSAGWTVGRWLRYWLSTRTAIRPTTRLSHTGYVDQFLIPHLGAIPLAQLSTQRLAGMFTQIGRQTNRSGKPHTPSTLVHIRTTLRAALNAAHRDGLLPLTRRDSHVTLMTCMVRGRASSDPATATAAVLPLEQGPVAQRLLDRRYGLVMRFYRGYARRRSRTAAPAYVAIDWTAA
jgi:hypothetical protein